MIVEAQAAATASENPKRHHALFLALVGMAALVASAIFANNWLQRT